MPRDLWKCLISSIPCDKYNVKLGYKDLGHNDQALGAQMEIFFIKKESLNKQD